MVGTALVAVLVVGFVFWLRSRPLDEAAAAWSEYRKGCDTVRTFVHGTKDMGKWRAQMPAVCITIPDKPVWSVEDVELLQAHVRRTAEPGETKADADGRKSLALIAGDGLVSRFFTQQGMTEPAMKRIREFMLEELRTADTTQRGYIATEFISKRWHYTDSEVRSAVFKVARDPDEFLAHTVRLNLGYTRDWVKRAIVARKPGIDPTWANDKEIEALAK